MNPFDLLKKDHKKVAELLDKLEKTTERGLKTRDQLFQQVKEELELHSAIEEEIFYPALQEEEDTKDITLEAFEEHKIVKTLLEELDSMPRDDDQWAAKLTVLKENVEHHVEEEEGEMFKKAKKALNDDELEDLGDRMAEQKKEATAAVTE